ncbi:MAG: methionine adenosyltransferase [Candidatus Thermoplasmatota archaeon]|nr:methionine adenosyltransferase [Candidatus Thermoplasmatota archaeon]
MRNIKVSECCEKPAEKLESEIVERKGIGHPDSVADGIAESISRELSKMYLERYGRILHHNTDQMEIVGGQSKPAFNGGMMLEPVFILLAGRATTRVNEERLPYRSTAVKATKDYLKRFKYLNVEEDITIDCRIGQGSVDLRSLYDTQKRLANDTSFGVSYAPFSETEKITLETEHYINGELKEKMKGLGYDVKVMSLRNKDKINVTVAVAMIGKEMDDLSHYISLKEELREKLLDHLSKYTQKELNVDINTADDYENNVLYLTVTGLSMENGDDGSVGRGNRVNGLITPNRPMSLEAAAGKNPVIHVGKLYNILAMKIAEQIVDECGVEEAHVRILSQIGKPIDQPQIASIDLITANGSDFGKISKDAQGIADEWLADIERVAKLCVEGKVSVF